MLFVMLPVCCRVVCGVLLGFVCSVVRLRFVLEACVCVLFLCWLWLVVCVCWFV